jgi:hypothetical protein
MKTLRTIAALLLSAFLVFGPTLAFAAGETVTASTNAPAYSGQSNITVSGTVTPAPAGANTAVVVTTKGPAGVVDTGTSPVATGTGAYSYTFVSGGGALWVQGTYTVNATYGGPGGSGSTTTTFTYNPGTGVQIGGGGPNSISVQLTASTPVAPGAAEFVAILTSFAGNGSLAAATFQTVHYHTPANTLVTLCSSASQTGCTGTFTTVHKGFYTINFTLPSNAAPGGYFIHAWTNGPVVTGVSTGQGQGLGQFTVQIGTGSDAPQLTQIQTTLNGITASIAVLTTGFGSINTQLQSVVTNTNGISSSLNTISTGVTGLTTSIQNIAPNLSKLDTVAGAITSMQNAINNNQTYVLVVAALAAITLVLELAILVRKLS